MLVVTVVVLAGFAAWFYGAAKKRSTPLMLVALGGAGLFVFTDAGADTGTLLGWLTWLASAAALAPVGSVALQIIKQFLPQVESKLALSLSAMIAVVLSMGANMILPILPELPPNADVMFGMLQWLAGQVWYAWMGAEPTISLYRKVN